MRDTKLYTSLLQLDGFELNRLHRFVLSPYFNRNDATIKLFEWLKEDLKTKENGAVIKEELWKLCFGVREEYNDSRFRKLQSDLLSLIEEFYAQEAFEANPIHKAKFLLDAIYQKGLTSLETSALKSAQTILTELDNTTASYFYYKYEIEKSLYQLSLKESERKTKSNLDEIVENLDRFYLIEKLKYYSFMLDHQTFAKYEYKMLFTQEILDHLKNNKYVDVPAIQMYYQILLTLKEPDEKKHYLSLKILIQKYSHLFPEKEAKEILDAAFNYCITRSNEGNLEFVKELFELYKESIESKLIFVDNQLTPWSFKNIITAGLRLNEFDWVEQFIRNFNVFLEEKFRDNAITFNLAQLYFYKKDYEKVIKQLSKVEYEDFTYNLNSKTLLMASYFELDEFEALNSLLDAFRLYVKRNEKLTKGKSKHYLNTISIVRKMTRLNRGELEQINKLEREVSETQGLVSKNWILEKLAALKA